MMKKYLLVAIGTLIFLTGCNSSDLSSQDEMNQTDSLKTKDSIPKIAPKKTYPKVKKEEQAESPYPILLIQNCAALIPYSCFLEDGINQDSIKSELQSYFKQDSLISIGAGGVIKQGIGEIFCMHGECNGNQLAIELRKRECFGVLMGEKTISALGTFHYVKRIEKEKLATSLLPLLQLDSLNKVIQKRMNELSKLTRASNCNHRFYIDDSMKFVVQRAFFEHVQKGTNSEDDFYYQGETYQTEYSRTLLYKDGKWIKFPWVVTSEPWGFWQREAIAYSLKGDSLSRVLYQSQGICCPSESTLELEIAKVSGDSLLVLESFKQEAGLGQPCD